MALTYTEIEQQKNTRILLFFFVVLLFYFVIALVLGNGAKFFFTFFALGEKSRPYLNLDETLSLLLAAALTACLHIWFSMSNAMHFIKNNLRATDIDAQDRYHKTLREIVDEVNVATGSKYTIVPVVIPTMAMNAFAISGGDNEGIIGVTEGLLSRLTRDQLQAVVAHEVAHIASGDSFETTVACSLFGVYAAMLNGVRRILGERGGVFGKGGLGAMLFLFFIFIILSITQFFYSLIKFAVSRNRELRADAIAVRLTRDPLALSEALYLIAGGWRGMGYIDPNFAPLFIINPVVSSLDEKEGWLADLFSTHPPIQKRIKIMAEMAHSGLEQIIEKVNQQSSDQEKTRQVSQEKQAPQWLFMDQSRQWQGPYTIAQMMVLGWLSPETWIKPLGGEAVIQAKEESLLQPAFDERLKSLPLSSGQCPLCKQTLVDEEYEGTLIQRCVFCQGVLAEADKIPRIIARQEKGFDERVVRLAKMVQQESINFLRKRQQSSEPSFLICPHCQAHMVKRFYTYVYLVEVHKCAYCGRVWFDKDELEIIQYLIENKETAEIQDKKGGLIWH
ncbi:MAG: zinc metalloprotease HtpX [Candidatus Omnitrophota bacterium]